MSNITIGNTYYLNKKYSYPIKVIGIIVINEEVHLITKTTPLKEGNEVIVNLLKLSTLEKGLQNGIYTKNPMKPVRERDSLLDFEDSSLASEIYETGFEDALNNCDLANCERDCEKECDCKDKQEQNEFVDEDMENFCKTIGRLFGLKPTEVLDTIKKMYTK